MDLASINRVVYEASHGSLMNVNIRLQHLDHELRELDYASEVKAFITTVEKINDLFLQGLDVLNEIIQYSNEDHLSQIVRAENEEKISQAVNLLNRNLIMARLAMKDLEKTDCPNETWEKLLESQKELENIYKAIVNEGDFDSYKLDLISSDELKSTKKSYQGACDQTRRFHCKQVIEGLIAFNALIENTAEITEIKVPDEIKHKQFIHEFAKIYRNLDTTLYELDLETYNKQFKLGVKADIPYLKKLASDLSETFGKRIYPSILLNQLTYFNEGKFNGFVRGLERYIYRNNLSVKKATELILELIKLRAVYKKKNIDSEALVHETKLPILSADLINRTNKIHEYDSLKQTVLDIKQDMRLANPAKPNWLKKYFKERPELLGLREAIHAFIRDLKLGLIVKTDTGWHGDHQVLDGIFDYYKPILWQIYSVPELKNADHYKPDIGNLDYSKNEFFDSFVEIMEATMSYNPKPLVDFIDKVQNKTFQINSINPSLARELIAVTYEAARKLAI